MPQKPEREVPIASLPGASSLLPNLEQALDLLACPACLAPFHVAPTSLTCTGCARVYPVEDGIPILLIDRAIQTAP